MMSKHISLETCVSSATSCCPQKVFNLRTAIPVTYIGVARLTRDDIHSLEFPLRSSTTWNLSVEYDGNSRMSEVNNTTFCKAYQVKCKNNYILVFLPYS